MTLKLKLQLAISAAVLVSSLIVVRLAVYAIRSQAAADAVRIRAEKTAQVKQDLTDKVNTVYALIDEQYKEAVDERYLERRYGQRLRAILDVAGAALQEHIRRAQKGEVPRERAQREAISTLRAMRFDDGKGYLWINTVGRPYPTMVMHPILPQLEGKVLDSPEFAGAKDDGRNLFQVAVDLTSRGDGFIRYTWPEPDGKNLLPHMPKVSRVRRFEEWGWIVGTGIYVDAAVREKLAETTSTVRSIRYGSEYFWINTADVPVPRMVMHPIRPDLEDQPLDRPEFELVVNGRRQNLFHAFRDIAQKQGEGLAEYVWPRPTADGTPGQPAAKLSFVKLYKPLNWVIGTGRHVDDIEASIAQKTAEAEAQVTSVVRRIALSSLAIIVLTTLAVGVFAGALTKPLAQLVGMARDIAVDDKHLSRRIGLRTTGEIGELARGFDHMAERLEQSFRRIREQRELLRSVLSTIPHSIYWKDRRSVFLGCNEPFAQTFGLPSPEAIVGKTDAQLGSSEKDRKACAARDAAVLSSGEALLDERETLRDAAGREVDYLVSRVPLHDAAGALIGVLGVLVAIPAPSSIEKGP